MPIINLTQHDATPEQIKAGVVEPADKAGVQSLMTFDELPTQELLDQNAVLLARFVAGSGYRKAMIGGAPFFMAPLERALYAQGIKPLYAFSHREATDTPQSDGSVKKTQVFRHVGFVG